MTLAPGEQSLTSRQGLSVLISPSLSATLSLAPAWSHANVVHENDADLLPVIVNVTSSCLPEATQLT